MRTTLICLAVTIVSIAALPAQTVRHEVRDGETLYAIARTYGVSVDTLMDANRIETPELLLPGTVLTVPGQYTVRKGDTLYSIARRYGLTVAELREMNDLDDSMIVVGQHLRVPDPPGSDGSALAAVNPASTHAADSASPDPGDGDGVDEGDDDGAGDDPAQAIPVAAAVVDPLTYDDGGAWPVAGRGRTLDGKFPGVMISAARGTPVSSVTSGRIVYSGPHSSFGNVVFVQSAQGYIYVYGGQDAVTVQVGDEVEAGRVLGTVGVSPTEGGPALYFSVWRNNRFVDPERAPRG